jgi:hypothetical protein
VEITTHHVSQATLVALFVLVAGTQGDTNTTGTSTSSPVTAVSGNVTEQVIIKPKGGPLSAVLPDVMAADFIGVVPHPIRSSTLALKESLATFQELTRPVPQLLSHSLSFVLHGLLQIAALVLSVTSLVPPFILPAEVTALFLTIPSFINGFSHVFNKDYLSAL